MTTVTSSAFRQPSPRRALRALAVSVAVACASWATTALADTVTPAPAARVAAAESRSYNIPSGTLPQVLQAFAQQAGVRVSFDPAKLNGLTSPGLKGQHAPQAALDAILAGSGYVSKAEGDAFVLVPAPPASAMLGQPVAKAD
jgi:type II secretory pathway component GspD/PulD (secretin)